MDSPEAAYLQLKPLFFSIAYRILHSFEDTEDCIQDAAVQIVKNWEQRRGGATSAWACMIVRNEALTILRKRKSRRQGDHFPLDELLEQPTTKSHEEPILARVAIAEACGMMEPRKAEVIRLRASGQGQTDMLPVYNKVVQFRALQDLRTILEAAPVRKPAGQTARLPS